MFRVRPVFWYLAVALALFSYIYFFDAKFHSTKQQQRLARQPLSFELQDVQQIQLRRGEETIIFRHTDGSWMLEAPVVGAAESQAVTDLLLNLRSARVLRTISMRDVPAQKQESYLSEWGLKSPALSVQWKTADKQFELWIGRKTPSEDAMWVRLKNDPQADVYVLDAAILPALEKKLVEWRSRALYQKSFRMIEQLTVEQAAVENRAQQSWEFSREKMRAEWKMQKPMVARADREQVQGWLQELCELQIDEFAADAPTNPGLYGLITPAYQIGLADSNRGAPRTLLIGAAAPQKPGFIYAKWQNQPSIFTLPREPLLALLKRLPELRDHRVVFFEPLRLNRIRLERAGAAPLDVMRLNDRWWFVDQSSVKNENSEVLPALQEANVEAIARWVQSLVQMRAVEFLPQDQKRPINSGSAAASERLVLYHSFGVKPGKIEVTINKMDAQRKLLSSTDASSAAIVTTFSFEGWPANERDLKVRRVFTAGANQIKTVGWSVADGRMQMFVRDATARYSVDPADGVLPEKGAHKTMVDGVSIESAVQALCQVQAIEWLDTKKVQALLAKPALTWQLTWKPEGASTVRASELVIGSVIPQFKVAGARAAKWKDEADAFALAPADYEALLAPAVAPKAPAQ